MPKKTKKNLSFVCIEPSVGKWIEDYIDGTLPIKDYDIFSCHLKACAKCKEELKEAKWLMKNFKKIDREVIINDILRMVDRMVYEYNRDVKNCRESYRITIKLLGDLFYDYLKDYLKKYTKKQDLLSDKFITVHELIKNEEDNKAKETLESYLKEITDDCLYYKNSKLKMYNISSYIKKK